MSEREYEDLSGELVETVTGEMTKELDYDRREDEVEYRPAAFPVKTADIVYG